MERYGYGHPAYGSSRVQAELAEEERFLAARRDLTSQLHASEQAEATAADKLAKDSRACEIATAEATEQSRRAAMAEQIYARAAEEYRIRDAECKAAAAAAAEAAQLFSRATEAARRAQDTRDAEVAEAQKKAQEARQAEADLQAATQTEAQTAETLARLEANAALGPVYTGGYTNHAIARGYGYRY